MNASCQSRSSNPEFKAISSTLDLAEQQVLEGILDALSKDDPKPDASACDKIFGEYYTEYLNLCEERRLTSRAAAFSRLVLIPAVLALESRLERQFHKGALFYDTGVAHLLTGNEDGYEYFVAMTDEEEHRKTSGGHARGTMNQLRGDLTAPIASRRMRFACRLLNGKIAGHPANYKFMTGTTGVTDAQLDAWRKNLDQLHQFELFRIIHDVEVFLGDGYPVYAAVADNPFVMLRLAKALTHLAQWTESRFTDWQKPTSYNGLWKKLHSDPDFGPQLDGTATAEGAEFPGDSPHGAVLETELRQLLASVSCVSSGDPRRWRLLRILYLVRNSTAHSIDPNLAVYRDRAFLLNLLQAVLVSVFVICQLKGKPMP